MFEYIRTFFVSSGEKVNLEITGYPEFRDIFYYESGELLPAYSLRAFGPNRPYIRYDGHGVTAMQHTVGDYRLVPNRNYSGLVVSVKKDIDVSFKRHYHVVPEDVRKKIRAYEFKSAFKLRNDLKLLSITHGEGILEASISKYVDISAICVYNFPGYEQPKVRRHYPISYVSYEMFNLSNPRLCSNIIKEHSYDALYFDASISYSGLEAASIISLLRLLKCDIIIRLSIFNTLSKLCELFRLYSSVYVYQPISSMPGDYYANLSGFVDGPLDFAHASLAYSICTLNFEFSPSSCMVLAEKVRGGRPVDYTPPKTSVRTIEEFLRLSSIWTSGLRLQAAKLVIQDKFFRDILLELLQEHSWTNNPFLGLDTYLFKEQSYTSHIPYAVTNDFAYVQVSQSGHHLDQSMLKLVSHIGAGTEHMVPLINNMTMEGSIKIRIDRDLNEDIDFVYYRNYLPYFKQSIEYIVNTYSHIFENVEVDFADLVDQCNKSSSVGLTARRFAPGSSSIGEALGDRDFIMEAYRVFKSVNSKEPSEENLLFTMFGKNHEILPPTKLYQGQQVPRLLIFKGAQYRIGLSGMFLPVLRAVVAGKFPIQVGKTPMIVAKELLEEWEKCDDPGVIEIDLSNWDGGVQLLHQLGFYYILSRWIEKFKQSYVNYFYHEIFKFLTLDGRLYYGYAFRSTGGEDTLVGNSFMHMIVVVAMLIFSGVIGFIWFSIVGDDGIFIANKKMLSKIDFTIYNAHGMRLKNFPCTCLEDARYLGHGYSRTRFMRPGMLRPLWELLSRAPYVWSNGENRDLLISKVTSYYLLYFNLLEWRIISLCIIQMNGIEELYADMSERGMGYIRTTTSGFMDVVDRFWGHRDTSDFLWSDNALYNIYETSREGRVIEPMDVYSCYLFLDDNNRLMLPRHDELLAYFEYASKFMRERRSKAQG